MHFLAGAKMAPVVPGWIPFAVFWVHFTGVVHVAAGLAMVAGRFVRETGIALAVMLLFFAFFIQLPMMGGEQAQTATIAFLKDVAMAGAALSYAALAGRGTGRG
jgi:uncharacterized membrane protein YphA (DoxX/SURF4 family)